MTACKKSPVKNRVFELKKSNTLRRQALGKALKVGTLIGLLAQTVSGFVPKEKQHDEARACGPSLQLGGPSQVAQSPIGDEAAHFSAAVLSRVTPGSCWCTRDTLFGCKLSVLC